MLVLANCGGENSQKAKKLLSRILTIVGIPYDIVVNICQDDNGNGICESTELQAKLTINKGDSVDDIWKKIAISDDGKYLLQHHDPTKKIIMEIKDPQNVTHNNGEFALIYNPMTTELSILQYMIDTGHLTTDDVNAVREMDNVDEFYEVLLKDFETNLNILQDKGLSPDRAVLANSKEIAEELISNGIAEELPKKINACDGNQSCIDEELESLSKELVVDENETETIKEEQTQTTKELLAGKTFYAYYTGDDGKKHIAEVKVDDNATSWSYKDIVGGENSGTETIEVDIDKLKIYHTDEDTPEVETVIEREKYLAIGEDIKFFYNRDDAQEALNSSNIVSWQKIAGKTLYYYDGSLKYMSFSQDLKTITNGKEIWYISSWSGNKLTDEEGDHYLDEITDTYIKGHDKHGDFTLYFNENDAKAHPQGDDDTQEDDDPMVSNLVSGKVDFVDLSNVPSDAWVGITPSRYKKDGSWNRVRCKIDSNGNFGNECYIDYDEQGIRNAFNDSSETFQVVVFKNHIEPTRNNWNCGEDLYKYVGRNEANGSWQNISVKAEDYEDRSDETCDD
jgi:hypothetical protein